MQKFFQGQASTEKKNNSGDNGTLLSKNDPKVLLNNGSYIAEYPEKPTNDKNLYAL